MENLVEDFPTPTPTISPTFGPRHNISNLEKTTIKMATSSGRTLTLDKVKALLEDDPISASNIHQLSARELKTTMINCYYLTDTLTPIQNNLKLQFDSTNTTDTEKRAKLQKEIDYVKEKIKHLEDVIEKNNTKLQEINDLKSLHNTLYPVPKTKPDGTSEFSSEDAVFRISYFSNDGKNTFSEFYDKLRLFVESNNLNDEGVINLLGTLLRNEPFRTFMEFYKQNSDLKTIISGLSERYSDKKTITHYERALRNITRRSGESLRSVMSRASYLILMTNKFLPSDQRTARLNHLQVDNLLRCASPKAREELEKYIREVHREGLYADYTTLLNLAIEFEEEEENPPYSTLDN